MPARQRLLTLSVAVQPLAKATGADNAQRLLALLTWSMAAQSSAAEAWPTWAAAAWPVAAAAGLASVLLAVLLGAVSLRP